MRKELNRKMNQLFTYPLSVICAPKGYGKAHCVKQFIANEKVDYTWITLTTSSDEEIVLNITKVCGQEFGQKNDFVEMLTSLDSTLSKDFFLIFENFSDECCPDCTQQLLFIEKMCLSHIHVVLLTEQINNYKIIRLFEYRKCFHLNVSDFKLSSSEIIQVFKKHKIVLSNEEAIKILQFSEGWSPAIEMALQSYQNGSSIFSTKEMGALLEKGGFANVSEDEMLGFMRLSILPRFTLEQALYLTNNKTVIRTIVALEKSNLFVKKVDFEHFTFSSILSQYLKQALLVSELDYSEVYYNAGLWHETKNETVEALKMYLEGNCFDQIIRLIEQTEYSLMDIDPDLMQQVFQRMPDQFKYENPYVYLAYICDTLTNINVYNGFKLLEVFRRDLNEGKYGPNIKHLLGEYYFIRAFTQFNDVEAMMSDFHLSFDALDGKQSRFASPQMIATFGSCHMLYLYHREKGALAKLVDIIQEEVKYFIQISNGVNAGSEFQTRAELALETGDFSNVYELTNLALQEANRNQQLSIMVCAYFTQGRLAILQKNDRLLHDVIQELEKIKENSNIIILQCEVECALAYLYMLTNQDDSLADWIKQGDISSIALLHEAWGMSYVISILHHLYHKNFKDVLIDCDVLENHYEDKMHLFGMYYVLAGRCIASFYLREYEQSMETLKRLLELCEQDHIITIYLELHDYFYDIFVMYEPQTTFEKEVSRRLKEYRKELDEDLIFEQLTPKEREVASLFVDAKTARDVAQILMISENTVRTHLKSVYSKLNVTKKSHLVEMYKQRH